MTDDRNRKSGNHVSKFCIHDNCNNEAIYNHWGMKPRFCFKHKEDYHVNILENPVSKFCNHDNCNKTSIYNYWGMKPRFCFDHKDEYHINIPKKHILCTIHYISHSPKTKCPKCKIKKSPKCDECNITASYNFPKLRPLKCLKHRKTGMVNIKRKHVLCKKHDISHSKESGCKICKLDIDNYDNSSKYMQDKIYKQFKKEPIEKIKNKFKNHHYKQNLKNILNNSKDEKIIKFKKIIDKRKITKHKKKNKNKQNNKIYICKLFEENKKLIETIKKIEHAEIKEWMLDHGEKEDEITEESIKK